MNRCRRLLMGVALAILIPCFALARPMDSGGAAAADAAVLERAESEAVSLEKAAGEGARDMAASMSAAELAKSAHVGRAREDLDALLRRDPTNVRGNILYARLGLAAVLCTPLSFDASKPMEAPLPASAADLDQALDRALLREPDNAEVYYWKATVCAAPIVRATVPTMTRTSLNFEGAVRAMKRAVELAPDSVGYREALAFELLDLGRPDEARDALRPAAGGQHPMYRLLSDWTHLPHPPNAAPCPDARGDALTVAARHGLTDWTNARVDAFVCPAQLKEVEAFYARLFPGFAFYQMQKQENEGMTARFLVTRLTWKGESLIPAGSMAELGTGENSNSIELFAAELKHPTDENRERYAVPKGDVFCIVTLTNSRRLGSDVADAVAIAPDLIGTYEASPGDDRATLEFGNGRGVRLSVFYSGAEPRVLEGEHTIEGERIVVRFPGAKVIEPGGEKGVWHVTLKGETLVALINRDSNSCQRFEFTKK